MVYYYYYYYKCISQYMYVQYMYVPDLDDRIYDCLLTAMAAVQAADVRASFLFVGDLNHEPSLGCGPRFCHCIRL